MGFFDKLKQGLTKTKESINDKINNIFLLLNFIKNASFLSLILIQTL